MRSKGYLILGILILLLFGAGALLIFLPGEVINIENKTNNPEGAFLLGPSPGTSAVKTTPNPYPVLFPQDIEPQKQLENPPQIVKAVYLTNWSAGREDKIREVIELARNTEINAVVIDIKDFSGYVGYDAEVEEVERYGGVELRIPRINSLIKRLHDEGIYVIARMAVFQDQVLARARPELAVKSISLSQSATASDDVWRDYKGLAWIDPAASESWDYNIKIAQDAASRGFDEINFDYIRFPTDGDLEDRLFPVWDGKRLMSLVMKDFYKEIRRQLPKTRLSIDLFGLAATSFYDFGVGQLIEDTFQYFDIVSPMLYPSHFPLSFLGNSPDGEYKKSRLPNGNRGSSTKSGPAEHPYEVVRLSMDTAFQRLAAFKKLHLESKTILRPWLQDFDLAADYDAEKVRAQIQAVIDSAGDLPLHSQVSSGGAYISGGGEHSEIYRGFILWNPANVYTKEALLPE